jgi:hypothetical protein
MTMRVKLIHDGMNKPYKIQPYGDKGETLKGQFRPMTPEDVDALQREISDNRKLRVEILAKHLSRHVLTWDAEGGEPSAENLRKLPDPFLSGLELVVTGYAASAEAEVDAGKF